MNNKIKISVITPSFNQAQFIESTINSVLDQENLDIEYIIIDGGSTDNTVEILKKYNNIIWISEKDNGQSHAINKGLKLATGEIIAWLNSDDLYTPNALKTVIQCFEENPEIEFLYGDIEYINKKGEHLFYQTGPVLTLKNLIEDPYIMRQPSCFWRKSLFDKVGYLKEELNVVMDLDLAIRMLRITSAHYYPFLFSKFRYYNEGKSIMFQSKQFKEMINVLWPYWIFNYRSAKFLLGRYIDTGESSSLKKKIFNTFRKK